jgi:hypothetical protein
MIRFDFDTDKYDFNGTIKKATGLADLALLHQARAPTEMATRQKEQWLLAVLYKSAGDALHALYLRLLHEVVEDLTGPLGGVQPRVCLRVHIPCSAAQTPSFHCDHDWGQAPEIVNLWVPYVDVSDSTALWVETQPGLKDHRPVNLRYGEAIIFPGAVLSHGRVQNVTQRTRISGDLRFLPKQRLFPC